MGVYSRLLIDPELISSIAGCHRDWTVDAASNLIASFPEDKMAEIIPLEGALFTRNDVKPPMNRLFFADFSVDQQLDVALKASKGFGIPFRVEVHPYLGQLYKSSRNNEHLIGKLIQHGFTYDSQTFTWIKDTGSFDFQQRSDTEVRIYGQDKSEEYFSTWYEGDAILENKKWIENEVAIFRSPHWFRYIFFYQGKPAATSIAYHNGSIFSCFYHETRKPFRKCGLQQYSLQFRTQHAQELGCHYVIGATAPQNLQSQRNFHRNDFQIACNWSHLSWKARFSS